jgi:exopolysaccharide production protein ExoZ
LKLKGESFRTIQLLRFVAALMVVFTHATFYVASRIKQDFPIWETGTQGVKIFFVISGFVMALAVRSAAATPNAYWRFALSRLIRIVPLYWSLNFFKLAQVFAIPGLALANPDWANILLSLLFIFSRNADGQIETFYGVGWTLNFEMSFYFCCCVALLLRMRPVLLCTVVFVIFAALGQFRTGAWPAATFLFNDIVLNFIWGLLIAELLFRRIRIEPFLSALAVACGAYIIIFHPDARLLGFQYATLVGGLLLLEKHVAVWIPQWAIFGGDSSYSLYLIHPAIGAIVATVLARVGMKSPVGGVCIIVLVCLAFAVVCYLCFERPVTLALKSRFLPHRVIGKPAVVSDAPSTKGA